MFKFTQQEIREIYNSKVKKNKAYFDKQLYKCPVKMWNYSWRYHDAPRCWCIMDFIDWIKKYNLEKVDILNTTSVTDPELEFITANKINEIPYGYNISTGVESGYDLHNPIDKEKCDFFLFNQTIEHLYNPFECIKNIYNNVKSGGYVFTSVPTNCIPHDTPIHFANWTPMGLAMLFKTNNFEIMEIGHWGNKSYIHKAFGHTQGFPDIYDLRWWSNLTNQEKNICGCWILAKKT